MPTSTEQIFFQLTKHQPIVGLPDKHHDSPYHIILKCSSGATMKLLRKLRRESEKQYIISIFLQARIYSKGRGLLISTYSTYSTAGNSETFRPGLTSTPKDTSSDKDRLTSHSTIVSGRPRPRPRKNRKKDHDPHYFRLPRVQILPRIPRITTKLIRGNSWQTKPKSKLPLGVSRAVLKQFFACPAAPRFHKY